MAHAEVTFNFRIDYIRKSLEGDDYQPLKTLFEALTYQRLVDRAEEGAKPLAPNAITVTPFSAGETLGFVLDSCVELQDGSKCQVNQDVIDFVPTEGDTHPMIMRDENQEIVMAVPHALAQKIAGLGILYSAELVAAGSR